MIADISKIKSVSGAKMPVIFGSVLEIDDYTADISVDGNIENADERLVFTASLVGVVHTYCAKCLKQIDYPYNSDIVYNYVFDVEEYESEDSLTFEGNEIDFTDLLASVIRADMPIALACADDCKGLCAICGGNLNENECGCEAELVNPVFEGIKILFDS